MINHNHKLEWLLDRLSALNDDKEKVQAEIDAITDVLMGKKLEKRLNIIFEQIANLENEIQQENNKLNNKLIQKKFDDLIQIIQSNQILFEQIQQAYQKTLLHWSARVKQNLDDVRSIVNELNKIPQGSLPYSGLDEFIANFFNEVSDVAVTESLTQWGKEYRQDIDWFSLYTLIQESEAGRFKNASPAILITIARSDEVSTQAQDGEIYYQIEAWSIEDIERYRTKNTGFQSLLKADNPDAMPCSLADLQQKISRLLEFFLIAQTNHCPHCENYPEIHVFLPSKLMDLGVDVWLLKDSPRPEYLGHDRLVFIHCANRYNGTYQKGPSWRKLWKRHQNLLQAPAQEVFISGHDLDLDNLRDILDDSVKPDALDSKVVGLYITEAPVDLNNLVYELLDAGLPLAIWSRRNLAESAHRIQVSELLKAGCLETLPSRVKAKRFETRKAKNTEDLHVGHHLSLLWDDPNFCPPKSA